MLTVTETAQRLGVTPRRVRAMIAKGQIRATKVNPRLLLVHEPLVDPRKPRGRPRKDS